ncbi:MAG TPA: hypothetical protein VFJ23_01100 [Candidatus Nitrosotalea sp.]|nr:hypothetical protein [Candidatus Nitrosotalea sp.]
MKIQNNRTKTATTIIAALLIGLVLISPTTMIPNVNALAGSTTMPKPIVNWLASHPHFAGCVTGNLKTEKIKEVPCIQSHTQPMSFSWSHNLDCSSRCLAGGEFNEYSSYDRITGDTNIGSQPSSAQTGSAFAYWSGLTNCSGSGSSVPSCPTASLLVQSGWLYNATSGGSINGPFMFTEIWGNFEYGGVYCDNTFCGSSIAEPSGDSISTANYADVLDSEWVAYATDNYDFDYTSTIIPFSDAGHSNSLPYPVISLEAIDAPNINYFPSSSISFSNVSLYIPNTGMVDADTNYMQGYYGPTVSSGGIPMTFDATGTTTATVTNSWS